MQMMTSIFIIYIYIVINIIQLYVRFFIIYKLEDRRGCDLQIVDQINTTGVTSGVGTVYPSGAPQFTLGFLVGFVLLDLYFYMYVLQIVVCPFVLFLSAIVLSVLLRYTDSDYPFGIFKLFLYYICHNHNLVLSSFMNQYLVCNNSNTTGATCRARNAPILFYNQ